MFVQRENDRDNTYTLKSRNEQHILVDDQEKPSTFYPLFFNQPSSYYTYNPNRHYSFINGEYAAPSNNQTFSLYSEHPNVFERLEDIMPIAMDPSNKHLLAASYALVPSSNISSPHPSSGGEEELSIAAEDTDSESGANDAEMRDVSRFCLDEDMTENSRVLIEFNEKKIAWLEKMELLMQ
jgi:hypothetical protein